MLDVSVLGKFDVVMMDPPWRINMSLPYNTMSDAEMIAMPIKPLQDEGVCFVWVITRALEVGRKCLRAWGYELAGEILWVKVDQVQRLKRTGRTGPFLNHTKEHCLIGLKRSPGASGNGSCSSFNFGIDCDVIVAPNRETSRKPDEIYGLIERLCPGGRKLEIFGRQHNTRPNWLTLGNQLDGCNLHDEALIQRVTERYGKDAATAKWLGPPSPAQPPPNEAGPRFR